MFFVNAPALTLLPTLLFRTTFIAIQKGFTLIELVIVIVILGILAVTAAPRFIDVSRDARIATLEGMAGALKSGVTLINAKAVIAGLTSGEQTLTIDSVSIDLVEGYPAANFFTAYRYAVNLDNVANIPNTQICEDEWCGRGNQLSIPSGITTSDPGRIGKLFPEGFSFNDQCGVYYLNRGDGSVPEIGLETADC